MRRSCASVPFRASHDFVALFTASFADLLRRDASDDGPRWHIAVHHGSCRDDRAFADGDPFGHHYPTRDPRPVPNFDAPQPTPEIRCLNIVICGNKEDVTCDHDISPDPYTATGIDLAGPTDVALPCDVEILWR